MFKQFGWLVVSLFLWIPLVSHALSPSASQLQMLQSLPDSQKQALIDKYAAESTTAIKQAPEVQVDTVQKVVEAKPVKVADGATLKPFGSFLFSGKPTTFAPVNDVPVPTDYILGPGDQLKIHLFGTKNESFELVIDRNGDVSIPTIGPLTLAGMSFSEAKAFLLNQLKTFGVGVKSSITMGALRSFRIFVLGESRTPGSYLVSGMATITHALYVSGGLTDIASFRNIQLKRQGRLIKTLDLYDLLLKGDTSKDVRLQPGDSVFIPKLTQQVSVSGALLKPALYELKHEKTMADLLNLVGQVSADAYMSSVQVSRVKKGVSRELLSLNLTGKTGLDFKLKLGDRVHIPKVEGRNDYLIRLSGLVSNQVGYAWKEGIKLTDVLPNREAFLNNADLTNVFIKRQAHIAGDYTILKANWQKAKADAAGVDNIAIEPRDQLIVLHKNNSVERRAVIDQLMKIITQQASQLDQKLTVSVSGQVKFPGEYPLLPGLHIKDLIEMSGELNPAAMLNDVEVLRYAVEDGNKRVVETISLNLRKAQQADAQHNIKLQPYDVVTVRQVSDWSDAAEHVVIKGEVAYPGSYVIKPGDTLESLLIRAGGFTEWAVPQNTVFTRQALKQQERREMDAMADELEKGLLFSLKTDAGILEKDTGAALASIGQSLISKIKSTPALGRLVVGMNPKNIEKYQATMQIELKDGDQLIVPKRSSEIVVMGEVARSASLLYQSGLSVDDYLKMSGDLTKRADDEGIYIVKGDGMIVKYDNGMFVNDSDIALSPGDTIIVPMDVERVSPIVTWTAVSKVLSNLAITAATLQTIGVIN
jgi:polysaccharide export outer membrane protein